jgi:hypothetical protein
VPKQGRLSPSQNTSIPRIRLWDPCNNIAPAV